MFLRLQGGYFLFITIISIMTIVRYKMLCSIASPSFDIISRGHALLDKKED